LHEILKKLIFFSERRDIFGETDESAQKRAQNALENGLNVIYCLGEHRFVRKKIMTKNA
jgi:triosephosphate isomerase